MSNFFDLDSQWRYRETYPNPAKYEITGDQIRSWFRQARTVRAQPQNPNTYPLEFSTVVNIHYLTLPYFADLLDEPRLYVNIRSKLYNDIHLLNAIDGRQPDAKFVCEFDKVQLDSADTPIWVHYKCTMSQAMRFRRGDSIIFEVTDRVGAVIPNQDTLFPDDADPQKQILCTFEITPYIRDGIFDNQMIETKL